MRIMQRRGEVETLGSLCTVVLGMLHQAGDFGTPEQTAGGHHAGGDCEVQGGTWPGQHFGVRAPFPGETPISWEEVHHAVRQGIL